MSEIYNFVAALCSDVIGLCTDETVFVEYSCISAAAEENIKEDIYKAVPKLSAEEQLKIADIDSRLILGLESYREKLLEDSDIFSMIGLLQVLDTALENMLIEKIKEYRRDNFSVVLNTNRETTGVGLLPRCSCTWERKHRLSHSYNRLDNFLVNFLLMENVILGELIDKHYFLKEDTFPELTHRKRLKVAATALGNRSSFEYKYYEKNNVRYFCVTYDETKFKAENELIWKKIQAAAAQGSDMVVFPEMMGNPKTVGYIGEKLAGLDGEEQLKMPALIILPSFYQNRQNTVVILDRRGNVVCRQSKQNPYIKTVNGESYLEDIVANNVVNIFHCEGIGRMAVLICKDFLTTRYMEQLMRCFKLTLIIVPSNSTGSYDFRQSFDLCAHDDCNVVWINTCEAFIPGKEANFEHIGYVRKRIGRNDDDSQKLCSFPICKEMFSGKCEQDCIYFETIRGV